MSEEKLMERIRKLETRAAVMLASLATFATCCVAFLGIEYTRIPGRIQEEVNKTIGLEAKQEIDEAKDSAEDLLSQIERMRGQQARILDVKNGDFVYPPEGTRKEDWVAFITPIKMGRHDKDINKNGHPVLQSEGDNAFLAFSLSLDEEVNGWKITAVYMFRYDNSDYPPDIDGWHGTTAKVVLIPSLNVPTSNPEPAGADPNREN
jgi:hypothetical protein